MLSDIQFDPIKHEHISLLVSWLNTPHVRLWYSQGQDNPITYAGVAKKLEPRITGKEAVYGYIVHIDTIPVGYIQVYDARLFPRDGYNLTDIPEIKTIDRLAAIDFYIGNPAYIGKGYGTRIVKEFLEQYVKPYYNACLVDPDIRNSASIRCFEKAGFNKTRELKSDHQHVIIMLLVFNQ